MTDVLKIGDGFPQSRLLIFPKSVANFPEVSRADFLKNGTALLPKTGAILLLEQSQFSPKTYFLLLLQFRISARSPKG